MLSSAFWTIGSQKQIDEERMSEYLEDRVEKVHSLNLLQQIWKDHLLITGRKTNFGETQVLPYLPRSPPGQWSWDRGVWQHRTDFGNELSHQSRHGPHLAASFTLLHTCICRENYQ